VLVEAAGLALIWLARDTLVATAGAALGGLGYSLLYPGFGVEAVRRVAPENRGLAMGLYTAFLDVALGFGTPALGVVADRAGLDAVFMVSAVVVLPAAGIALALALQHRGQPLSKPSF
jgi:predicted MFS family arabinose efflux permease